MSNLTKTKLIKLFLRYKLCFDKKKRYFRKKHYYKYNFIYTHQRDKLGVSYSVWEDIELLEESIKQIRTSADYINVVWQKESWFGEESRADLEKELLKLQQKGLIDELIRYNVKKTGSYEEPQKRQLGLDAAIKNKCNYFLIMDCDEFYETDIFENAYQYIKKNNITHSIITQKMYGLTPDKLYLRSENYSFVLFISKINKNSKIAPNEKNYPVINIDPSRKLNNYRSSNIKVIPSIVMHHMSYVRNDLQRKINNSSAAGFYKGAKAKDILEMHKLELKDFVLVEDKFNLLPLIETNKKR